MNEKKRKEVGNTFAPVVLFDVVGKCVEGRYDGSKKIPTNTDAGESTLHLFKVDAEPFAFWGTKLLDLKMHDVKPGQHFWATFTGMNKFKKGKKNLEAKGFKVEVEV